MKVETIKVDELGLRFTYDDYAQLPSDGKRYEVINGEVIVTPAPTTIHQRISRKLEYRLEEHVTKYDLGEIFDAPCDVILSEYDIVQPDLFFISNERSSIITEKNIQGAPDLVIEIISPESRERDRTNKNLLYAQHGVREYWLVDTERKPVEVWSLSGNAFNLVGIFEQQDRLTSKVLPKLEISLSEIF